MTIPEKSQANLLHEVTFQRHPSGFIVQTHLGSTTCAEMFLNGQRTGMHETITAFPRLKIPAAQLSVI